MCVPTHHPCAGQHPCCKHLLAGNAATNYFPLRICVSSLTLPACRAASVLQHLLAGNVTTKDFPLRYLCVFSHTAHFSHTACVQGCVCAATPACRQCHHQIFSPQMFMCVLSHCTLLSHCLRAGLRLCCNTCLPAMPLPNIFPSGFMCLLSHCPRAGLRLCCNTCWLVMPPPRSAFCTFLLSSPLFPDPLLNS
jgi:hypothetical protein